MSTAIAPPLASPSPPATTETLRSRTRHRRRAASHPLLDALLYDDNGVRRPLLPSKELLDKTPWERIYSVVPMLINKAGDFIKSIPCRDRASGYELEDVVGIFAMDLVERNDEWQPERGAYTTFVGIRCGNVVAELRGKARVVQTIRGNVKKLSTIAEARNENRLTSRMHVSEQNLTIAASPIEPISEAGSLQWDSDTLADLEEEEELLQCRRKAILHIRGLPDTTMGTIMGMYLGTGEYDPMSTQEIADKIGMTAAKVSAIRHKAEDILRELANV